MTLWNSTIDPGQPWVITSGKPSSCGERWWMKWIGRPSISVVELIEPIQRPSRCRQS
jgi:hypothetical protein